MLIWFLRYRSDAPAVMTTQPCITRQEAAR
jgi:hypothetical protein